MAAIPGRWEPTGDAMPTDAVRSLFGLEGRVALVTGGTSGIGEMIAAGLAGAGAQVWLVGRDPSRCEAAARRIGPPGQAMGLVADLSGRGGVARLIDALGPRAPRLDILVNNAGAMREAPIEDFSENDWDEVVDLNLRTVFFLTQALLPRLREAASEARHASVINIGSMGGRRVGPKENYAYAASKAGLHHLTGSLARRLGPDHITVNAIAPGLVPSGMTRIPPDSEAAIRGQVPRRRFGGTDDMAGAAIYLASRAGAFVSGVVLPVDGGMSL